MGALTSMQWPKTTLLNLLDEAEASESETFDIVHLELNSGRSYLIAVVSGECESVDKVAELLESHKKNVAEQPT